MSYDVSSKKYPIAADVDAVATFLAQRQSDSATTNGGIVATGSPTVPQLGVDVPGLGLAYLKGMADALMCGIGFQAQNYSAFSSNNTSSTNYVDVPGSSFTFAAQIAKTYTVNCNASAYINSTNGFGTFRLVVNGSNGPDHVFDHATGITLIMPFSLTYSAACAAGNNTIKLQWKVDVGTTVLNTNSNCFRNYTVSG